MNHLFRTKSIDALIAASEPGSCLQNVGPWSLTAWESAVIGSGIFILTGTAAAGNLRFRSPRACARSADARARRGFHHIRAGPAFPCRSTALACSFAALCAELASMIPIAGSATYLLSSAKFRLDHRMGSHSRIRRVNMAVATDFPPTSTIFEAASAFTCRRSCPVL
jgi:hypothetical protein